MHSWKHPETLHTSARSQPSWCNSSQEGEAWKSFADDAHFVVVIINMVLNYNFVLYEHNFIQ